MDEVYGDNSNENLEPSQESFEDDWRVPKRFDLRQTDNQIL